MKIILNTYKINTLYNKQINTFDRRYYSILFIQKIIIFYVVIPLEETIKPSDIDLDEIL